jgi:hypothetical protein
MYKDAVQKYTQRWCASIEHRTEFCENSDETRALKAGMS